MARFLNLILDKLAAAIKPDDQPSEHFLTSDSTAYHSTTRHLPHASANLKYRRGRRSPHSLDPSESDEEDAHKRSMERGARRNLVSMDIADTPLLDTGEDISSGWQPTGPWPKHEPESELCSKVLYRSDDTARAESSRHPTTLSNGVVYGAPGDRVMLALREDEENEEDKNDWLVEIPTDTDFETKLMVLKREEWWNGPHSRKSPSLAARIRSPSGEEDQFWGRMSTVGPRYPFEDPLKDPIGPRSDFLDDPFSNVTYDFSDTIVENHFDDPAESPSHDPVENHLDDPAENPLDDPVENFFGDPIENPFDDPADSEPLEQLGKRGEATRHSFHMFPDKKEVEALQKQENENENDNDNEWFKVN